MLTYYKNLPLRSLKLLAQIIPQVCPVSKMTDNLHQESLESLLPCSPKTCVSSWATSLSFHPCRYLLSASSSPAIASAILPSLFFLNHQFCHYLLDPPLPVSLQLCYYFSHFSNFLVQLPFISLLLHQKFFKKLSALIVSNPSPPPIHS